MEQRKTTTSVQCWIQQRREDLPHSASSGNSWYSSLENLKLIRRHEWIWLTRFKRNRHVNPDGAGNRPLNCVAIAATGTRVHLKGYGIVKVFKLVAPNGDIEVNALPEVSSGKHGVDFDDWATNDLNLDELQRLQWSEFAWAIEDYHRGLKHCCGAERAQVRASRAQRNTQPHRLGNSSLLALGTAYVCHRC